jgi:small subunit ribosomal protein S4
VPTQKEKESLMARYKGPKCRLCRREGVKLYLKGARCDSEKCAINKRNYAPGQHGNSRRRRGTDYGKQLREKQKAKRIYGLLEKQFRKYVDFSLSKKGVSGEMLMQQLETRLDNVVYRSGFAVSRAQARQFIRSGYYEVNGKLVTIPSYKVKAGDVINPVDFDKLQLREGIVLPDWVEANVKEKFVKFVRLPSLDELGDEVNVQLIIEFYSR